MENEKLIHDISAKYIGLGENPETYLKGLLSAKPITYWDYIEVDTLLSLQKPRTDYKDEEIFIMYHQVTELFLKLMLHEIKQVWANEDWTVAFLETKFDRIIQYTHMLINSFDIMRTGMSYDDYNIFRNTLAPASGFQSAQFRMVEIYCTRLINLVNEKGRERLSETPDTQDYFEHIYWKDAGMNRTTGEKKLTLRLFEEKYLDSFLALAQKVNGKTLEERLYRFPLTETLVQKIRDFDYAYNVTWPSVHLNTARHYLDSKNENQAATGGSEWKKYLHPMFQQRKFFPQLWTTDEISQWGKETLPEKE
jgi:tryptophan 2,3-dioxygenase